MRASGATNFGLPFSVVVLTKSVIAFFAAPSFHDGSGSVWACAWLPDSRTKTAASIILFVIVRFIGTVLPKLGHLASSVFSFARALCSSNSTLPGPILAFSPTWRIGHTAKTPNRGQTITLESDLRSEGRRRASSDGHCNPAQQLDWNLACPVGSHPQSINSE